MGKAVDRWALRAALACGAYLLFLNAWGSVPLAGGLTLGCAALLGLGLGRRSGPRRRGAAGARAELYRLAAVPEAEAGAALLPLLRARWPGEEFELKVLQKHPSAGVGANDILSLWKQNRGAGRLLVAATCPADARAVAYARSLDAPAVAVLDARALARLLRDAPAEPFAKPPLPARIRQALHIAAERLSRPAAPRFALFALAMLALYVRVGQPLYLFGGLWVAFRLGAGLMGGWPRRRLF